MIPDSLPTAVRRRLWIWTPRIRVLAVVGWERGPLVRPRLRCVSARGSTPPSEAEIAETKISVQYNT